MTKKDKAEEIVDAIVGELRDWKLFRYALDSLSESEEDDFRERLTEEIREAFGIQETK